MIKSFHDSSYFFFLMGDKRHMKFIPVILLLISPLSTFSKFNYHYAKKQTVRLDGPILSYCMAKEIAKYENPKINPSSMYKCNQGWAKKMKEGEEPEILVAMYDREILDNYLRINPKRPCDYETGKEPELRKWVMAQKDNSIDHIKIFAKALEITNGNVFNSFLMIHQLLRNEARYWSTKYYAYESNPLEEEKFWNKFVDIRGELPERGPEFTADHAGSWYRMWGMMMNRIADTREPIRDEQSCGEDIGMVDRGIATLWNEVVAIGAEAIKPVFVITGASYKPGGDLMGKTHINLTGNEVASTLDAYFSGYKFTDSKFRDINCDKSPYIIPVP
jgi:hypothetical protein